MDNFILFALACFAAYLVIAGIYKAIQGSVSRMRQKKLDEIARDVVARFDFNKEKEEIKSIGARYVPEQYRCPRCHGMLVMRNGIYGKFWGCNHYPECKYTRNIK